MVMAPTDDDRIITETTSRRWSTSNKSLWIVVGVIGIAILVVILAVTLPQKASPSAAIRDGVPASPAPSSKSSTNPTSRTGPTATPTSKQSPPSIDSSSFTSTSIPSTTPTPTLTLTPTNDASPVAEIVTDTPSLPLQSDLIVGFMSLTPYWSESVLSGQSLIIWERVTSAHIQNHILASDVFITDAQVGSNVVDQRVTTTSTSTGELILHFTVGILFLPFRNLPTQNWKSLVLAAWEDPMDRAAYVAELQQANSTVFTALEDVVVDTVDPAIQQPTESRSPSMSTSTSSPSTSGATSHPSSSIMTTPNPTTPIPSEGPSSSMNPTKDSSNTSSKRPSEIANSSIPTIAPTTLDPTSSPTAMPAIAPSISPTPHPTRFPTNTPSITSSVPTQLPVTIFGSFELLETVPHDSNAFTQGLELAPSSFPNNNNNQEQQEQQQYYESTGQYGASSVRIVDLQTGEVLHIRNMDSAYFGEGMTHHDGTLVQITWKKGTGFVYNATNLDVMKEFTYQTTNGEGWGICYEPSRDVFFVSDGTNYVHTWDSSSFQLLTKVPVTMRETATTTNEQSVYRINELEWDSVTQTILANIWQTNDIVRIDPQTGFVTHRYNLQSLYRPFSANVLNGIAVTDTANEIWVTGKYWPNMYRIRLMDG